MEPVILPSSLSSTEGAEGQSEPLTWSQGRLGQGAEDACAPLQQGSRWRMRSPRGTGSGVLVLLPGDENVTFWGSLATPEESSWVEKQVPGCGICSGEALRTRLKPTRPTRKYLECLPSPGGLLGAGQGASCLALLPPHH